ncbi:MAG TPA: lipoprotein [Sphingobium sp.]
MKRSATLLLIATLALGACGRMGPLERTKGMKPLPVATGASRPATAAELIRPNIQTRPQRNVDILSRSDRRAEDPFDKPPGADNGRYRPQD